MAKKKAVKPDASTEQGAGRVRVLPAKKVSGPVRDARAAKPRDVIGTVKNARRPPGRKKIDPAKAPDPVTGETEEQKRKRIASEEAAAQLEEDAALAKSDMDYYLRNAWPDAADREQLLGLITNAVRTKQLYVGSSTFVDQVWGLIETTPQYAARFPGLVARKASSANGQVPMTPADYMQMEDMFDAAMATYMIPPGVMDRRTAIAKMVENDVTVQEMEGRIDLAAQAATEDESFLKKFSEYQGMTPGHLIAFYLDPDLTAEKIQKQERVFKVGAMMDRYGFQGVKSDAQQLADLGMSEQGVMSSLDRAAQQKALMSGLGSTVTESQLIQGSATEGAGSAALQQIRAQREGRFTRGGGASEGQAGVAGLGSASST